MPVIPTLQRQGASQVRAVKSDIGQGLTQAGSAVRQVGERMQQAKNTRVLSESTTEATRQLSAFEDELKADPDSFETWSEQGVEARQSIRNTIGDSIEDSRVREAFDLKFSEMDVYSETRVRQGARGLEVTAGRAAVTDLVSELGDTYATMQSTADRMSIRDSVTDALDDAADTGVLTELEAAQQKDNFLTGIEMTRALTDIDADPTATATAIGEGEYDLDAEDLRVVASRAQTGIAQQQVQMRRDQALAAKQGAIEQAWEYSGLMDLGETNQLQAKAVEEFAQKYADTQAGAREWLQLRGQFRDQADTALASYSVKTALFGDGFISPDNPDEMTAANDMYKALLSRWPVEDIPTKAVWFASRLGVVPDALRDSIIGPLGTMHDPDAVVLASDVLAKLTQSNPGLATAFHKKHVSKAVEIQAYAQGGLDPKDAVELYNRVRDVQKPIVDARDKEFTQYVSDGDYAEQLGDAVDDLFDADAPPEMLAMSEAIARSNYAASGNFEVAIAQAAVTARSRWGASLFDDDVLQLDAPSLHYSVESKSAPANRKWQQEQLRDDIAATPELTTQAARTNGDYMVSTSPTTHTPEGKPVYTISGISKADGTIIAIGDWVPDFTSSKQFIRDAAEQDDVMQQLYRDRKQYLLQGESRFQRRKARREAADRGRDEGDQFQRTIQEVLKQQRLQQKLKKRTPFVLPGTE